MGILEYFPQILSDKYEDDNQKFITLENAVSRFFNSSLGRFNVAGKF